MFGLITFPILHKLFFAGKKKDAVKSTLRRLTAAKLIAPLPLIDKRVYYQLTPNGCAVLEPPHATAPVASARRHSRKDTCPFFLLRTTVNPQNALHPRPQ